MSVRPVRTRREAYNGVEGVTAHIVGGLTDASSVRETLPGGGRIHIDRPLPFICVCEAVEEGTAAEEIAVANASYLVAPDLAVAAPLIEAVSTAMSDRFGAFLVVDVREFAEDILLTDDSPYTPPFEFVVAATEDAGARKAADCFVASLEAVDVRYRTPEITREVTGAGPPRLSVAFAPIYRRPGGAGIYPGLRDRVIENIFDAILRAVAGFAGETGALEVPSHRAFGRRVYVDAVRKLDAQIDAIAGSFDFLLGVTPINSDAAWAKFQASGFAAVPRLLYRPLTIETNDRKRELFSIPFDKLEDPLLHALYREKQSELELQLTLLDLRDTPRFRDASRLLYGPVEPALLDAAETILAAPERDGEAGGGWEGHADCHDLKEAAEGMIAAYRAHWDGFDAVVEIRDDLPPGMMVSGPKLMISRSTRMARSRVEALLSHEVGVHLLTYFTGDAQGLSLFRSGLAGYEAAQEGLAVLGEYLVGGLTRKRMRLLAARVVGCAAMLNGATFPETFRLLHRDRGLSPSSAFNVTLRLHRSGGFAKDAIYLRGLVDVLAHIAAGRSLATFWLGKFAGAQVSHIAELTSRGLLHAPPIEPIFLFRVGAAERLARIREGVSLTELIP